jgi:hypothetical protein
MSNGYYRLACVDIDEGAIYLNEDGEVTYAARNPTKAITPLTTTPACSTGRTVSPFHAVSNRETLNRPTSVGRREHWRN